MNDNGQKFPIKRYPNISKVFSIICFKFESTLGTLWENINQTQGAKKFNHLKLRLRCVRGANSSSINITLIDLDCSSFLIHCNVYITRLFAFFQFSTPKYLIDILSTFDNFYCYPILQRNAFNYPLNYYFKFKLKGNK